MAWFYYIILEMSQKEVDAPPNIPLRHPLRLRSRLSGASLFNLSGLYSRLPRQ